MALIYLTRGYKSYAESTDFSKAASLADEVINSGQYELMPTFSDVFISGNEKNKEIIFSVQYDASSLGVSMVVMDSKTFMALSCGRRLFLVLSKVT